MNASERRALAGLASLYVFRMLGLFMVLPVMTVYGADYRGSTPALLGMALGVYGLSQALLQIPLGMLSDRWGRKPVMYAGLALFACGSLVAALTDSVYGLIAGRMLQGAGAIAAATMALVADLTRDENRGIAMAVIGAAIGVAFMLAAVLGPLLAGAGGLSAIFWVTMALALVGMLLLWRLVPTPESPRRPAVVRGGLGAVLGNGSVWRLASGAFFLHLLLTALFVPLPLVLVETLGLPAGSHWKIYGPIMLGAFVVMLPLMRLAERRGRVREAMLAALFALGAGAGALRVESGFPLLALLSVFFIAFNLLEALMPAQLTREAPAEARGAASGLYATVQFLGVFTGGVCGGWLFNFGGAGAVVVMIFTVLLLWALLWCLLLWRGRTAGTC
ncbi:MFS transporter [Microbulbifer thermotolerans]|uniref:MFS transporter n=1 Tax=Microbulbifer thermotolerans TaxID=252514 RepID=A0A143HIS4_MICTH|nr:MFS transporter [Microbulbifer thermotolerans]AMX01619.1 MFS transporter [Microbulbifer thermotolerans]MCX2780223.1 MFS transporter [Microbulbifer thermotolerans]MCX2783847.1 MFS transporter [Microbulbifer thermotolerans]MCX2795952.1 MFS transporter [Microbulbifer thermotolerans]MCX2802633.1 MFS transporter [Microbulbifer thermotolerans]